MVIPPAWQGACLPIPGEVCLAYFPFDEVPDAPGPVEHPVVVLALKRAEPFSVYVAYGTSKKLDQAKPWDLVLSKDEANEIGLTQPTKFMLDRRVWLPYDDVWFRKAICRPTPRLGSLPKAALRRLGDGRIAWELAHQCSLIPGHKPKATLVTEQTEAAPAKSTSASVEE